MGSKQEEEAEAEARLPLFSTAIPPLLQSPEHSATVMPFYYSPASVPFVWEEQPGKPKPCTNLAVIPHPTHKCLELPPRMLIKLSSPETVLDGPETGSRFKFRSSSFRIRRSDCYGSFGTPLQKVQIGALVLSKRCHSEKGIFGSWRSKVSLKREGYVFSSSTDSSSDGDHNQQESIIRRASVSPPRSQFWGSVYKGLKQGFSRNWNRSKKVL